jgi:hypothetical protein
MSGRQIKPIILSIATKLFNYMRENKVSFVGGKVIKGGNDKIAKVESMLKTLLDVILMVITIVLIATEAVSKDDVLTVLRHYEEKAETDPAEVVEEIVVHPHMADAKKLVKESEGQPRLLAIENIVDQGDVDSEVNKIMMDIFGDADDFGVARVADDVTLDDIVHELGEIGNKIDAKIRKIPHGQRGVEYNKDFLPRIGEGDINIVDKSKPYNGQVAPVTRFYPKKTVRKIRPDSSWIENKGGSKNKGRSKNNRGSSKRRKRTEKRRKNRK